MLQLSLQVSCEFEVVSNEKLKNIKKDRHWLPNLILPHLTPIISCGMLFKFRGEGALDVRKKSHIVIIYEAVNHTGVW